MEVEHLLVLPERDIAEEVANDLATSYDQVRVVREALAGEDDSEAHDWVVVVVAPDSEQVRRELAALALANEGWHEVHE